MGTRFSKTRVPYEADEQRAYIDWVKLRRETDWRFQNIFHIPNGAHLAKGAQTYFFLTKLGVEKGVPDIAVMFPSARGPALFIEMKRKGQPLQPDQKLWRVRLLSAGYCWVKCESSQSAIDITLSWFANAKLLPLQKDRA